MTTDTTKETAPTERIEVKFAPEQVDAQTGEFKGYGAIFGTIDSHGDVIMPGAFADSLVKWQSKGRLPAMKLMHGGSVVNPFGDSLPVGRWTAMREDANGLFVEGKLSGLDTDMGRRVHALMRDGVLDGLSIGYKAEKASAGSNGARRNLERVNLREVSLVDDPSNEFSRVQSVKSAEITTIREFESHLRDVGFSASAAKSIASGGYKAAFPGHRDDESDAEQAELLALAARIAAFTK